LTDSTIAPSLDDLLVELYVILDDELPAQTRGRPRETTDAELCCLAVAQALLGYVKERRFLRAAPRRLGHFFPLLPSRSQYNKRLKTLGPALCRALELLAERHPSTLDKLRLLDTTPIPCGQSRQTALRSALRGSAAYGYCAAHSRFYWGFKLALLLAPDGFPVAFELVPANTSEPDAARELLALADVSGCVALGDKGHAGHELEGEFALQGCRLVRPDRKDEPLRHGSLGQVRQWVESAIESLKGQLDLERHGGRTLAGVSARVLQRLLALAAALWHNQLVGQPGRHLTAYDH